MHPRPHVYKRWKERARGGGEGERGRYSVHFTSTLGERKVRLRWKSSQPLVIFTVTLTEFAVVKNRRTSVKQKNKKKKRRNREKGKQESARESGRERERNMKKRKFEKNGNKAAISTSTRQNEAREENFTD